MNSNLRRKQIASIPLRIPRFAKFHKRQRSQAKRRRSSDESSAGDSTPLKLVAAHDHEEKKEARAEFEHPLRSGSRATVTSVDPNSELGTDSSEASATEDMSELTESSSSSSSSDEKTDTD